MADVRVQREFFDRLAPEWRKLHGVQEETLSFLLAHVPLRENDDVLDVGCGTGVLEPYLCSRVRSVLAADVSEKMIERAKHEFSHPRVTFVAEDFYALPQTDSFDLILVFDAYPHFIDKRAFAEKAHALLRKNGQLWIFFDEPREKIDAHHVGHDPALSVGLRPATEEALLLQDFFRPVFLRDDDFYLLGLLRK